MSGLPRDVERIEEVLYETLESLRIETATDDIDILADAVRKSDWLRDVRDAEAIKTQAEAFEFTNRIRAIARNERVAAIRDEAKAEALFKLRAIVYAPETDRFRDEACRNTVALPYASNRYVRLLDDLRALLDDGDRG